MATEQMALYLCTVPNDEIDKIAFQQCKSKAALTLNTFEIRWSLYAGLRHNMGFRALPLILHVTASYCSFPSRLPTSRHAQGSPFRKSTCYNLTTSPPQLEDVERSLLFNPCTGSCTIHG